MEEFKFVKGKESLMSSIVECGVFPKFNLIINWNRSAIVNMRFIWKKTKFASILIITKRTKHPVSETLRNIHWSIVHVFNFFLFKVYLQFWFLNRRTRKSAFVQSNPYLINLGIIQIFPISLLKWNRISLKWKQILHHRLLSRLSLLPWTVLCIHPMLVCKYCLALLQFIHCPGVVLGSPPGGYISDDEPGLFCMLYNKMSLS